MRLAKNNTSAWTVVAMTVLALAVMTSAAGAVGLRAPQVALASGSLQGYLNSVDGGVTVTTDQLDAQNFASNVSGNADFTLMIELAGFASLNNIGIYNAGAAVPTLYQLFPGSAIAGYSVTCHFLATGTLKVDLADNLGNYLGTTVYTGVTRNAFAFYLDRTSPTPFTAYSQDYRNPSSRPQVLTFAGTGVNIGDWWECFEDLPYLPTTSDFDDAVLLLQSVAPQPVPTTTKSWGAVKAGYR